MAFPRSLAPEIRFPIPQKMILDKFNLNGKTALVTGSSRGLGAAIAMALAQAGANVAVHGSGTAPKATQHKLCLLYTSRCV